MTTTTTTNGRIDVLGAAGGDTPLSEAERKAHEEDERIIERGLATFVEVGRALARIRDRRSYLLTHANFNAYVVERWNMERATVYRLMHGAEVMEVLSERGVEVLPSNTGVAYTLREFTNKPDDLVEVWQRTVNDYGPRPLMKEVQRTVRGEPPVARQRKRRGSRIDEHAGDTPDEPDLSALTEDQANYVRNIQIATEAISAAKSNQRHVLGDADPKLLAEWSRRVRRLRALASDVQQAIDNKL